MILFCFGRICFCNDLFLREYITWGYEVIFFIKENFYLRWYKGLREKQSCWSSLTGALLPPPDTCICIYVCLYNVYVHMCMCEVVETLLSPANVCMYIKWLKLEICFIQRERERKWVSECVCVFTLSPFSKAPEKNQALFPEKKVCWVVNTNSTPTSVYPGSQSWPLAALNYESHRLARSLPAQESEEIDQLLIGNVLEASNFHEKHHVNKQ